MTAITADTRVSLGRGMRFQWEPSQSAHVLLYPEGMVKLNDSASAVLKHCDGRRVSDILDALHEQFPDADLDADVHAFLEDAHERGWIRTEG